MDEHGEGDDGYAEARACLSWALNFNGDYEGALSEAQRALLVSPNLASAHRAMGTTLIFSGQPRAGRAALKVSFRLDPRDPLLSWHLNRIAIAHYLDGDYEGAIDAAQRVIRSYPEFPLIYRWLAAAGGQASWTEEARQALDKAIAIGARRSTCTSAGACRGTAPKTTSICSTACARPAGGGRSIRYRHGKDH